MGKCNLIESFFEINILLIANDPVKLENIVGNIFIDSHGVIQSINNLCSLFSILIAGYTYSNFLLTKIYNLPVILVKKTFSWEARKRTWAISPEMENVKKKLMKVLTALSVLKIFQACWTH